MTDKATVRREALYLRFLDKSRNYQQYFKSKKMAVKVAGERKQQTVEIKPGGWAAVNLTVLR